MNIIEILDPELGVVIIENLTEYIMNKIEIKHRITGSVIFSHECEENNIKKTILEAITKKIDLSDADLSDADLSGADLRGADLRGADLRGADLRGADLSDADLSDADLRGAYLRGAYLSDADLRDADLRGAYLRGAYLSDAENKISRTQSDFNDVLDMQPMEVDGLLEKLREGKINGSVYEGDCCCLVGTIASVKGCSYKSLIVQPMASRPAERFFLSIKPGHTPENSKKCKEIEQWIIEWNSKNSK